MAASKENKEWSPKKSLNRSSTVLHEFELLSIFEQIQVSTNRKKLFLEFYEGFVEQCCR